MNVSVTDLRTDHLVEPLGIGTHSPLFGWNVTVDDPSARGVRIARYRIQVAAGSLDRPVRTDDLDFGWWDSGDVDVDDSSVTARYTGPDPVDHGLYFWRVRVTTAAGETSEWSTPAKWETGPSEWPGCWIGAPGESPSTDQTEAYAKHIAPAQYLRRTVRIDRPITAARFYATALGWYQLHVNGHDVTGDALVPRFTSFDHRVEYQAYDLTPLLHEGDNVIGLTLADGRFRGNLSGSHRHAVFGARTAVRARLDVFGGDDSPLTVGTDTSWVTHSGPVRAADPMMGVDVDQRMSIDGWDRVVEPTGYWPPAEEVLQENTTRRIVPESGGRVRGVSIVSPVSVTRPTSARTLVDFGQNLVGIGDFRLSGRRGDTVTITYSEALDGERVDIDYVTEGTRLPRLIQRDSYTFGGDQPEWFRAPFTTHGFRYAQIDGPHGEVVPDEVTARVIAADIPYSSTFECSHSGLNALHSNIVWSMRGNFTDVPTDCPTRERSGWTADIAVFAPSAVQLADVQAYLHHWLADLALDQHEDGRPTLVVPSENSSRVPKNDRELSIDGASGWGDAAVIVPWVLYQHYGDTEVLERQYESMTKWIDYLTETAADKRNWTRKIGGRGGNYEEFLVDTGFQFGEWMVPGERPVLTIVRNQIVPPAEVATAYFAYSSGLVSTIAKALGKDDDSRRFAALAENAAKAWREEFLREDGRIEGDEQSSYVRGLEFGLAGPDLVSAVGSRLVELVKGNDYRLDTGFLSTARLLDALTSAGRLDVAYAVLMQDREPSWLHQVERGATTIWETWAGVDRHGRANKSLNHYALGGVSHWLYDTVVGIEAAAPGFSRVRIAPRPGGGLTHASASIRCPHGPVAAAWRFGSESLRPGESQDFTLTVDIPPGVTAEIRLPSAANVSVLESGHDIADSADYQPYKDNSDLVLTTGSGHYEFRYTATDIAAQPIRGRR